MFSVFVPKCLRIGGPLTCILSNVCVNCIYIILGVGGVVGGLSLGSIVEDQGDCACVILVLCECIWNASASCLSSQPLTLLAPWVLLHIR